MMARLSPSLLAMGLAVRCAVTVAQNSGFRCGRAATRDDGEAIGGDLPIRQQFRTGFSTPYLLQ